MIRLAGGLMVCTACGWVGWRRWSWYRERRRTISDAVHALDRMAAELNACQTDTAALLALLAQAQDRCAPLFARCLDGLDHLNERPFAQLWEQALRETALPLREEERVLFRRVGSVLGRYEGQEQARLLSGLRRALEGSLEDAREEERRLGRLSLILGLSVGLLLVLLILPG